MDNDSGKLERIVADTHSEAFRLAQQQCRQRNPKGYWRYVPLRIIP